MLPRTSRLLLSWVLAAAALFVIPTTPALAEDEASPDADDAQVKAAMEVFKSSFKGDEDAKAGAVEKLGEVRHPKVFAALAGILCSKDSEVVRSYAARALGAYKDKRTTPHLLKAFEANKKDTKVLEAVIGAIGDTKDAAAAEALGKYASSKGGALDKRTIDAAYACVDTLGKLKAKSSIEDLLKLGDSIAAMTNLDSEKSSMRNELLNRTTGALRELTGEDLKGDDGQKIIEAYKKWWKKNEKTWDPNKEKSS